MITLTATVLERDGVRCRLAVEREAGDVRIRESYSRPHRDGGRYDYSEPLRCHYASVETARRSYRQMVARKLAAGWTRCGAYAEDSAGRVVQR